jgi:hypothetical protein
VAAVLGLRILATIALAAAALALAACGSNDEANDYIDEVNSVQEGLVTEVTDAVSQAPPANPEAAAAVATDLETVFNDTADELEAIEPPDDVAELHDDLVAAVRDVGTRIGDAEQAFSSGNPQQAAQAALELQQATTDLQTELNTLIDDINEQLQG